MKSVPSPHSLKESRFGSDWQRVSCWPGGSQADFSDVKWDECEEEEGSVSNLSTPVLLAEQTS